MTIEKIKPIDSQARAEFILTYKCNLHCSYCHVKNMAPKSMSRETAIKTLEIFYNITKNYKYLSLSFTGGEPLLEIDILKNMVDRSKELSILHNKTTYLSISTNATLLDEQILAFVKLNNIELQISIDGDQQSHDSNRKYRSDTNTFTDVITKTKRVIDLGINYQISLSVSEENAVNLYTGVETLVQNGIFYFKIGPVYKSKDWSKKNSTAFCKNLIRICCDAKRNNTGIMPSISPIDYNTQHINNRLKGVWGCSAGLSNLAFTPDGQIIGCSSMAPLINRFSEFKIGTIENLFIDEDLKYFFDLRKENPQYRSKCVACLSKDVCSGGCLAINATATGDPYLPPEHYCDAIKSIPEAWRLLWQKD